MSTTFLHSATFVYWYCGTLTPIVLAIGIYANVGARIAAKRRRDALTTTSPDAPC